VEAIKEKLGDENDSAAHTNVFLVDGGHQIRKRPLQSAETDTGSLVFHSLFFSSCQHIFGVMFSGIYDFL
jgi:hypothetical protein